MAEFDEYSKDYKAMLDNSLAPFGGFDEYYLLRKVDVLVGATTKESIGTVLDFGCGIGAATLMLQNAFPEARVVGMDVSRKSILQAQKQNPSMEFGCSNDEDFISNLWGSFDLIYIANVFHHIPVSERASVIATLKKLLKPNGKIFYFEHNTYNPITKWVVSRCEFDRNAILLTPNESRDLLISAGLNVNSLDYLLFFPHSLKSLQKLESYIKWLPLGAQYCISASL